MKIMQRRDGFSLIELLTVIAIIGILASLIFPAVTAAKRKATETQCINNMLVVFTAVKQFQLDERKYPEFIAGPALNPDGSFPTAPTDDALPMDETKGMINGEAVSLYPEYIDADSALKCPSSGNNTTGSEFTVTQAVADPAGRLLDGGAPAFLYAASSYDYQQPELSTVGEAHYARLRTNDISATRQLKWKNPPSDTVITWCSYHRGREVNGSYDIVLFLDGHTYRAPTSSMLDWTTGWTVVEN